MGTGWREAGFKIWDEIVIDVEDRRLVILRVRKRGKKEGRGMVAGGGVGCGVADRGNQNVFWKPGKVPVSS